MRYWIAGAAMLMMSAGYSASAQQLPPGAQPQVQIDPQVSQTFQSDQVRILSDQLNEWENIYLARMSKYKQDWAATWAAWCGSRPLCGLQPKVAADEPSRHLLPQPQSRGPLPHSEAGR